MKLFSFLLRFNLIVFISTISISVFSQSAKLSIAKEPDWVTVNPTDYSQTALDKDAFDGFIDTHIETQISLSEKSKFVKRSKKIISQAGVQNGSTIVISFDPSYEQLTFHTIRIIRKRETLNKLEISKIKLLHQEEELTSFLYNGSVNATLILEDVRQGDIIEYSYTIKGFNPVFNDKFAKQFDTQFDSPVYDFICRLLVPKGRMLDIKNFNETLQPAITESKGQKVYEWHKTNIPALVLQDKIPSWYNPYARISVSEFKSWKEVNDWAMELFPKGRNLSSDLQKKIAEIEKKYSTDAARTMAALRFVQDDIRYMGFEMGINSHKPADPAKVFAQRFGDCKEKSYLLCCMLNAMQIEANPVLINTEDKKTLHSMLPAATDFNHATVRVKLDSGYYWFDPTIAYQRGNIKELFYPDYQAGLVVAAGTDSLTYIKFRSISYQHITDYFKVDDMAGRGTLTVTTTYKGDEADGIRSSFNNESVTEILNNDKKFYASYYEDIKADSLLYTDNDSSGIFTTTEYYTIPDFWTVTKDNVKKFTFSAFSVSNLMRKPKEKERKMPISLAYPVSYTEDVTVVLPLEWNIEADEMHLKNSGFTYNSKFYNIYNQVHLTTDYENHKDFVDAGETPEYFKNINEFTEHEDFVLSSGDEGNSDKKSSTSSKDIFSIVLIVGAAIGFLVWQNRRRS